MSAEGPIGFIVGFVIAFVLLAHVMASSWDRAAETGFFERGGKIYRVTLETGQ